MFRLIISVTFFIFGVTSASAQQFGWVPDQRVTEAFVKTTPAFYADDVKVLVTEDTNADALLYRALVPCLEKHGLEHRLKIRNGKKVVRAYNQGKTGSCVGQATAAALSILNAVEVFIKEKPQEFVAMHSADAMYGLCREAGGSLGRHGDGSNGGAAAKAITQYGTLYQLVYENIDLRNDNQTRAKQYGYNGVGAALKAEAANHKVFSVVRVKSASEAWSLIGNGYPINVCSGQGFERRRDAEGICRASGNWSHSMAVIGRRTTADGRKLFLIWNSWGDDWASGPYWDDMPQGSFFVTFNIMDSMLARGDSFAYSDLNGFPPRSLADLGTKEYLGTLIEVNHENTMSNGEFRHVWSGSGNHRATGSTVAQIAADGSDGVRSERNAAGRIPAVSRSDGTMLFAP